MQKIALLTFMFISFAQAMQEEHVPEFKKPSSWIKLRTHYLSMEREALQNIPKKHATEKIAKGWVAKSYTIIKQQVQKNKKYEDLKSYLSNFKIALNNIHEWKRNNKNAPLAGSTIQFYLERSGFLSKYIINIGVKEITVIDAARKLLRVTNIIPCIKKRASSWDPLSDVRKNLIYEYLESDFRSLEAFVIDKRYQYDNKTLRGNMLSTTVKKMKEIGLLPRNMTLTKMKGMNFRNYRFVNDGTQGN